MAPDNRGDCFDYDAALRHAYTSKNDPVGRPLVRYFEVAATYRRLRMDTLTET